MYKNYVNVQVLVNGRPVREYTHKGLTLIESRHGTNYTIKIKNDNSFNIMAVLSVDGLDVLNGKPAEDSHKGYIVDAYRSTEIKGYRLSDEDSASFVFTKKGKSYVTKTTGDSRNTGVIGVRVFKEKEQPVVKVIERIIEKTKYVPEYYPWSPWVKPYYPPYYPSYPTWTYTCGVSPKSYTVGDVSVVGGLVGSDNIGSGGTSYGINMATMNNCDSLTYKNTSNFAGNPIQSRISGAGDDSSKCLRSMSIKSPGVSACEVDQSVSGGSAFDSPITQDSFDTGTTWGKKQSDKIKRVPFKAGPILTEIVFYYATRDALEQMGVDLDEVPKVSDHLPSPFGENYCNPPKGWNG